MIVLACSMCGTREKVIHFYLHQPRRRADGTRTDRGAGPIDLCETCWREATANASMRGGRRRRPLSLIVAAAMLVLLVVGCSSAPANPRYIVDGLGQRDIGTHRWLVTVPCSQQPMSWDDLAAYCDLTQMVALAVTQEEYQKYQRGDKYP